MPGSPITPAQLGGRRGVSVKTLKKMLKNAGLKTTGRKAALTRRAKKAHLKMRGGADGDACTTDEGKAGKMESDMCVADAEGGRRRRRSRRGVFGKLF